MVLRLLSGALVLASGLLTSAGAQQFERPRTLADLVGEAEPPPLRPSDVAEDKPPQPVPDATAIEEARALIKQAFGDDLKAIDTNLERIIRMLLAAAGETKDPARAYALMLEAEDAAATGGSVARVMELIDIRADDFEIDSLADRVARLNVLLTPEARKNPPLLSDLCDHALETAELALEQEEFTHAKTAAELTAALGKSLWFAGKAKKDDAVVADADAKQMQAKKLTKAIERREERLAAYETAVEHLMANPDDAEAHGVVGRYLCFERDEWADGLASLSRCADKTIAEISASELRARAAEKPDAKLVFEVAGKWWLAAEAAEVHRDDAARMKQHAAELYEQVMEELVDPLDRQLAGKRVADQARTDEIPALPGKKVPRGLLGEYFTGRNFDTKVREQIDGQLDFDWGLGAPNGLPRDNFSMRWSGWLTPKRAGAYVITGFSDDGVRIALNRQIVVNQLNRHGDYRSPVLMLKKNQRYKIVVEYFESGGPGQFHLEWIGPDRVRQVVPTDVLTPAPGR